MEKRIYMLEPAMDRYRHVGCTTDADRLRVIRLPSGPVATHWLPLRIQWVRETKHRPICDYPIFSIKLDAYSNRAVAVLDSTLRSHGELLPLTGVNNRYSAYHLLKYSDSLDFKRSHIEKDEQDGSIGYVWRAVFKAKQLEPYEMFRIRNNHSHVFVQQSFVDLVETQGLTGFKFSLCELV